MVWTELEAHRKRTAHVRISELVDDPKRFDAFAISVGDMLLDYSKTSIDTPAMDLLLKLASGVEAQRDAMFRGDKINTTEGRSVLHTALRNRSNTPVLVDGKNVMPGILDTLKRMREFCQGVRLGDICAVDKLPFTDVINIGVGGSDLGPLMATLALAPYHNGPRTHFISNIDGAHVHDVLKVLNPARTLVIIASKSFTTIETMTNAETVIKWLTEALGDQHVQHLIAVSNATEATAAFGIAPSRVFSFEDWVGGRYSVWGPVGLPLMLAIGPDNFDEFLQGAFKMDTHFRAAPLNQNMPVLLALVGIWHNNICGYPTRAILPYDQRLSRLPTYFQQLDMESNGKSVTQSGAPVTRKSGPIIWGEPGTNGQHAFYQLIHQGTAVIPCEFLIAAQGFEPELQHHHDLLVANCLAQSEALMLGRKPLDAKSPHREFTGNRPSTTLMYQQLTPHTLGKILALYEHRVFVEGVVWGINSFDQYGVELGKELAVEMLPMVESIDPSDDIDTSTAGLLSAYHNLK